MRLSSMLLRFLIFVVFPGIYACDAPGPPFPRMESVSQAEKPVGRYFFRPPEYIFGNPIAGELYLDRSSKDGNVYFSMRMIGKVPSKDQYNIRIRSYEGFVAKSGTAENIVLRPVRCYIYEKSGPEEKLWPLERWDCEHLAFELAPSREDRRPGSLLAVNGEFSEHSGIYTDTIFHPLLPPGNDPDRNFAGIIYESIDDGRFLAWGFDASRFIRAGMKEKTGFLNGENGPGVKIETVIDDFVIGRWEDPRNVQSYDISNNVPLFIYAREKAKKGLF